MFFKQRSLPAENKKVEFPFLNTFAGWESNSNTQGDNNLYRKYYSEESKRLVSERYSEDISILNYPF